MRYLFDSAKRKANLAKHGFDLSDAQQVIESNSTVTFEDNRFAYDEPRFVTYGLLGDQVVVVVTAEADEEIRVISIRKADKHEQKKYFTYR